MAKQDNGTAHQGEKGLAGLITHLDNTSWKRLKIRFFEIIKNNPLILAENKEPLSEEDKLLFDQFISVEIICETVSYAELLGAYLLAFSKRDPVIQKTLLEYKVDEVVNLFQNLETLDGEQIAKIIGYPSLGELSSYNVIQEVAGDLEQSLANIKNELIKIGNFYLENRTFYNDYKHGLRIFPGTSSPPDSETFGVVIQIGKGPVANKVILRNQETLNKTVNKAVYVSKRIAQILEVLLRVFRERFIENKNSFSINLFGIPEDRED